MCTPRYQDIKSSDINSLTDDDGTYIRVIAGITVAIEGLVDGIDTDPSYLDVTLMPNVKKRFPFDTRRQGFAYILKVQPVLEMRLPLLA